jgi:hypothetical protein
LAALGLSSIAERYVIATRAPTPGALINRWQTRSVRAIFSISRCRRVNSCHKAARAGSIPPITRREHGMPFSKLADTPLEAPATYLANLETEAAQDAANAELDIKQLGLQQLASDKQGPYLLGADRLGMHRPIPSHAQQLCDPARVFSVGLHRHRGQCRLSEALR